MGNFLLSSVLFFVVIQLLLQSYACEEIAISERCGHDVLNSTSGNIYYKHLEPLETNERCVWVIRVENATDYAIYVNLGLAEASAEHQLTLTRFSEGDPAENIIVERSNLIRLNGTNVVLVTLHTGSRPNADNHTGFELAYEAFYHGDISTISNNSTDVFINTENGGFMEAFVGNAVSNYYITLFFFGWSEDHVFNPKDKMFIAYVQDSGITQSIQVVELYSYNPLTSWQLMDELTYQNRTVTMESHDLFLLAYRTRSKSSSRAIFRLVYNYCNTG